MSSALSDHGQALHICSMVVGKYEAGVVRVAALCWARVTMVAAGPGKLRQQASVSPARAVTAGTCSEDIGTAPVSSCEVVCCMLEMFVKMLHCTWCWCLRQFYVNASKSP